MAELRKCPFCGGDATFSMWENKGYQAVCVSCGSRTDLRRSKEDAKNIWNKRTKEPLIKVGDRVRVIDIAERYTTYVDWFLANGDMHKQYLVRYAYNSTERPMSNEGRVEHVAPHLTQDKTLALIIDSRGMCYLYNVAGLEKI